jgi:S1-C subfamily serine protease
MSENEKDNKDFEFIKEQVLEKKRRKLKKRLLPFLMTIIMAILFGLIAALTFVITEPGLYDLLHKEGETKTPVTFPTPPPTPLPTPTAEPVITGQAGLTPDPQGGDNPTEAAMQPTPIIQRIDAGIEDLININDEMRRVAYDVNKSIVDISSTFTVIDWFSKEVEKTVDTTGVIVADNSAEFLILVSLDRVQGANSIKLRFSDMVYVDAKVQDYESEINLALLAVEKNKISQVFLSGLQVAKQSYTITVGSPIIALGSPNGHPDSMEFGFITSKGSYASISDNKLDLFNTDIDSNENSDGIIVNLKGEIIGLITRTLKDSINEELSTAIAISKVQSYIELMGNKKPRIYFGIKAEDLTEAARQEHRISNGIYVSEAQTDSPAFEAGLKNGDIILSINDNAILNISNFYNYISVFKPGDEITVKIKRKSGTSEKEMDLPVVLAGKAQ